MAFCEIFKTAISITVHTSSLFTKYKNNMLLGIVVLEIAIKHDFVNMIEKY